MTYAGYSVNSPVRLLRRRWTLDELQANLDQHGRDIDDRTDTVTCDFCGHWSADGEDMVDIPATTTTELFQVHTWCAEYIDTERTAA